MWDRLPTLEAEREDKLNKDDEIETKQGLTIGYGDFGFTWTNEKIELSVELLGFGFTISNDDGGTFGIDLGVIGIELNKEGGGKLSYLWELYEIKVAKEGCNYIKEYYINKIYTYTEIQEIPGCNPPTEEVEHQEKREENFDSYDFDALQSWTNDKGNSEPDWDAYDFEKLAGKLLVCFDWQQVRFRHGRLGDNDVYEVSELTSSESSVPTKENFVNLIKYTGDFGGTCNFYQSVDCIKKTVYLSEPRSPTVERIQVNFNPNERIVGLTPFFSNRVEFYWNFDYYTTYDPIAKKSGGIVNWEDTYFRKWQKLAPPVSTFAYDENIGIGVPGSFAGSVSLPSAIYFRGFKEFRDFLEISCYTAKITYPFAFQWKDYYERRLTNFRVYNREGLQVLRQKRQEEYLPPIKPKKMHNDCCFTEDDRALLALTALATGALSFPGVVPQTLREITTEAGETIVPLPAQFPLPKGEEPSDQQRLISSLLEMKLWQTQVLAELTGDRSIEELLEGLDRLKTVLGVSKFPGIVPKTLIVTKNELGEEIVPPEPIFPKTENNEVSSRQQLVSDLPDFKLWQIKVLTEMILKSSFGETDRDLLAKTAIATGGIDGYPSKVPETMLGVNSTQKTINSTPEMLEYIFRYLDSVLGQYPIPVKIEDIDPSKEGKQSAIREMPNISEMLSELYGMVFTNAINIKDKRLEVGTSIEIEFIKKNLFQMKYQIDAIIDWLGFEPVNTTKNLKFAFNPRETDYNKFLEPNQEKIEIVEFKESKNNKDFRYYLNKLLIGATTIQKAFGIPINPNDITGSILNFIKGLGTNPAQDWEKFKEDLENGKFTDDNQGSSDNPKISDLKSDDILDS